jgi:hypothetical protein
MMVLKITQLGDRMNSLTSAMVGILVENTNDGTMLCLVISATVQTGTLCKVLLAIPKPSAARNLSASTTTSYLPSHHELLHQQENCKVSAYFDEESKHSDNWRALKCGHQ